MRVLPVKKFWLAAALALAAGIVLAGCMGPGAGTAGEKVNINSADAKALDGLPGIGPKLAADIVAYRKANGPFKAVDDLAKIDGLGKKTLEKVRPLVTVGR